MTSHFQRLSHSIHDLFREKFSDQDRAPHQGVLVTLVHTQGSSYQKAGAELFIKQSGEVYGLVAGGCLEQTILEEAVLVFSDQQAKLSVYDTDHPDDLDFGFGMGCGGKLWILAQPINSSQQLRKILYGTENQVHSLAVLIDSPQGSELGCRLVLTEEQRSRYPFSLLKTHQPLSQLLSDQGKTWAIYRRVPPINLVIFGAGPGSWPLAAMAHHMGWICTVYDHREALLAEFPDTWAKTCTIDLQQETLTLPSRVCPQAAVFMTHSFRVDQMILNRISPTDWFYIGTLGSQKRVDTLLASLDPQCPIRMLGSKIYGPAGLKLGGTDPGSISLAILAEIQKVFFDRQDIPSKI